MKNMKNMKKHEVGDKFVIEIDKVFGQDGETLYRVKGMKGLVFDEYGLNILKPMSAYRNPLEWIPVTERVPDKNGNYLITVRSYDETGSIDFICVDHCNSDGTWLHYKNQSDKKKDKVVIAWMPLPEPYMAGEQE